MRVWRLVRAYAGLLVLAGAMLFAGGRVLMNHLTYEAPDVTTIRICHWQLEAGFRESLDRLIREYEADRLRRTGQRVRVLQLPVSERGYRQFVNTGLIGGTAPDIIEKGKAKTTEEPAYVARFYLPLSRYVRELNPYNAGTPLEGVSWRDTFVDGMSSCYDRELQDYYYIPFSMFTIRIYYNRDLYRSATGRSEPPRRYLDLLAACREIREYAQREGHTLVPIAGSREQIAMFRWRFEQCFLFSMIPLADDTQNGSVDPFEAYRAYLRGTWNFMSPPLQAAWKCMAEIATNFQDGWLAAKRDDALFMFGQQRAVMLSSGSWDASSIVQQAGGEFEVGVFDFPIPVDHPDYAPYVLGAPTEAHSRGGIPWAVNSRTRHADLCIDFLRFCTTRSNNEQFNSAITWIPVVRGAVLSRNLVPFKPRIRGLHGTFAYDISAAVRLIGEGNRWTLYAGNITPAEYARRLTEVYERTARAGYDEAMAARSRRCRDVQRILAGIEARSLFAGAAEREVLGDKAMQILQSDQDGRALVADNRQRLEDMDAKGAAR